MIKERFPLPTTGDKNITVFAPTDDAFEELDDQILTYLQQNPKLLEGEK